MSYIPGRYFSMHISHTFREALEVVFYWHLIWACGAELLQPEPGNKSVKFEYVIEDSMILSDLIKLLPVAPLI